ncbi:hypothetical protein TcasGA2_TC004456 [Tribolium castaneum]|uniref:Myb-like domain-containing protein n=1 Tax=Tribolium castaneum TaxID=7070 RepID=D6WCT8_TRICA|nr:hypothetical protein TcasGA2_TC004456 [Tribolium castaneum]
MSFLQIVYDDEASDILSEEKLQDTSSLLLEGVNDITDDNTGQNVLDNVVQIEETPNIMVEWTRKETNFLLKKYNKYIVCTGPNKKFRTKRQLWQRVSQDIKNELKKNRSSAQCENRYKTILRKWRKQAGNESFEDVELVLTNNKRKGRKQAEKESTEDVEPVLTNNKPSSSGNEPNKETELLSQKDALADVLWKIFKQKEEGRERRHREKMELIKSLLQNN